MDDYKQYLKLLSFVVGISTDVVHHYFEIRILDTLTFETFLNREKHILFHEHIPTIECCQCALLSIAAQHKRCFLTESQFSLLFDSNGPVEPNHEKRSRSGTVLQYCLHSYSAVRNVCVDVMDITLVCEIVRKCCPSIPGNPSWLQAIRKIRNDLFHLSSGQLSTQEFEKEWKNLATAVIQIAGVIGTSYQKTIRKQIAELKNDILSLDVVKDIIKDINVEAKQNLADVLRSLTENYEVLTVLKKQVEKMSIDVRNLVFDVRIQGKSISPPSAQLTGECKTVDDETRKESDSAGDVEDSPKKCYVQWKFVNPKGWDIDKMVKRLTSVSSMWNEWFEIEFVYVGSLMIETTIQESIVADKNMFFSAIKSFVAALVDLCDLDSSSRQIIVVLLGVQVAPHVTASLLYSSRKSREYEEKVNIAETEKNRLLYKIKEYDAKLNSIEKEKTLALKRVKDSEHKLKSTELDKEYALKRLTKYKDANVYLQREHTNALERITEAEKRIPLLSQEKSDALTRLSDIMRTKLRDNNPAITDLNDPNRPMKLGDQFSELYENEWTDAFSDISDCKNLNLTEIETIAVLLNILKEIYNICLEDIEEQLSGHKKLVNGFSDDEIEPFLKTAKDSVKTNAANYIPLLYRKIISSTSPCKLVAQYKDFSLQYIENCVKICYFAAVQNPPMVIEFEPGQKFDKQSYREYTRSGTVVEYLVWPVLYLHKGGPILSKGVVQPKEENNSNK